MPAMTGSGLIGRSVLIIALAMVVLLVVGYSASSCSRQPHLFALISNDGTHLQEERAAGVEAKVVELSWRQYYPSEGKIDTAYVRSKKAEMEELRKAGFDIILSLGYHDTPPWLHENYRNTYYVSQFGEGWTGDTFDDGHPVDNGDANLVFNHRLRGLVASYMKDVFREFGSDFYAVRLGGGRYGELTYPPADFGRRDNVYWAYDENAQKRAAKAGFGGWRPGEPSPEGEAGRFLNWYLDSLVSYQGWQVDAVREAGYSGRIMMLYPGWGIRPEQIEEATSTNLDGSTSAEVNGEIQSGRDFARQVGAIEDENVLVTTTWLDADATRDDGQDPRFWSPAKYLSSQAESNPARPGLYGENTGSGSLEDMQVAAHQMRRYGLIGMAWYDEEQLFSGRYATLEDYKCVREPSQECGR